MSKEIEKLRVSIQTLCRSALPLGKTMDYLQEDADAMQRELQLWHRENRQHAEALLQEQRSAGGHRGGARPASIQQGGGPLRSASLKDTSGASFQPSCACLVAIGED